MVEKFWCVSTFDLMVRGCLCGQKYISSHGRWIKYNNSNNNNRTNSNYNNRIRTDRWAVCHCVRMITFQWREKSLLTLNQVVHFHDHRSCFGSFVGTVKYCVLKKLCWWRSQNNWYEYNDGNVLSVKQCLFYDMNQFKHELKTNEVQLLELKGMIW